MNENCIGLTTRVAEMHLRNNGWNRKRDNGSHRMWEGEKNGKRKVVVVPHTGRKADLSPTMVSYLRKNTGITEMR